MTTSMGEGLTDAPTTARRSIPVDTFAIRLRLVRIHAGDLTVREAADKSGLNYGSWSNWENGAKPRDLLDTIARISEGLDIDAEWLLFGGLLAPERRRAIVRPNNRSAALTVRPMSTRRRDVSRPKGRPSAESTRPVSAVPANKRRPRPVGSPNRPMAA